MRPNKLRALLRAGKSTLGTRVMSPWPTVIEVLGQAKQYDYVEFLAEYSPSDLHDLDNLCRAAELADLTPIIKIDQAASEYVAQRAIGAGFQGVMFTDCRSADEARHYVRIVRPETPQDGGLYGAGPRRFTPRAQVGGVEYLQALRDVVVILMIEKREAVENLDEILAVPGIDMIQWGPADYTVSIGKPGARFDPDRPFRPWRISSYTMANGRRQMVKPEKVRLEPSLMISAACCRVMRLLALILTSLSEQQKRF